MDLSADLIRFAPDANLLSITNGQTLIWNSATMKFDAGTISSSNFANADLTFTGNRAHNTAGYSYALTTDNGAYAQGWEYIATTLTQLGFNTNYIQFNNSNIQFKAGALSPLAMQVDAATGFVGIGSTVPDARLYIQAQGALSTDIVQRWRNSANTVDLGYIAGNGLYVLGINASSSPTLILNPSGSSMLRHNSTVSIDLNSSTINQLNSVAGWDIISSGGSLNRIRNGTTTFEMVGNSIGIGATPDASTRLDVRAQGIFSTDIALRVRNSANTSDLFVVKGTGTLNAANLPTSAAGLVAGDIWNNLGVLTIV